MAMKCGTQNIKFCTFILALCAITSVSAADFSFPSPLTISTNYIQTSGAFTPDYLEQKNRSIPEPRLQKPLPLASLTFKPSPTRRKENITEFLRHLRSLSPQNADAFEQQFAKTDFFAVLQPELTPLGLSVNNAADAYTVYWITLWEASHGLVRPSNAKEIEAVKAQVSTIMRNAPEFSSLTPGGKQSFTEQLYLSAMMLSASLDLIKDDPKQLSAFAKEAKRQAISTGFAVDYLTLTQDGFVPAKPRKRSDASDAVAGEEKALAANDAGVDKGAGLSPTQFALIAAAGGAGLGAVVTLGKVAGKKG
jgi:hypothetical protein